VCMCRSKRIRRGLLPQSVEPSRGQPHPRLSSTVIVDYLRPFGHATSFRAGRLGCEDCHGGHRRYHDGMETPCEEPQPVPLSARGAPSPSASSALLDKREPRIRRMFGHIAPSYDLLNHLLSLNIDRYWRWRTTRLVPPTGPAPILDL